MLAMVFSEPELAWYIAQVVGADNTSPLTCTRINSTKNTTGSGAAGYIGKQFIYLAAGIPVADLWSTGRYRF